MLKFMIIFTLRFVMGKVHRWTTFSKWRPTRVERCRWPPILRMALVPHPRALPYTKCNRLFDVLPFDYSNNPSSSFSLGFVFFWRNRLNIKQGKHKSIALKSEKYKQNIRSHAKKTNTKPF